MRNVAIRTLRIDLRASFTIRRSCCRDISPPRITWTRFAASATKDPETGKRLLFISNNTALPALSICALYKARWQVELFFRWIKMHLRVKAFFGTSENAVKSQIWIAVSVYVLVAIIKKRLNLSRSPYERSE